MKYTRFIVIVILVSTIIVPVIGCTGEHDNVPEPYEFSLKSEGEFVQWSMMVETKYMIALLFYG